MIYTNMNSSEGQVRNVNVNWMQLNYNILKVVAANSKKLSEEEKVPQKVNNTKHRHLRTVCKHNSIWSACECTQSVPHIGKWGCCSTRQKSFNQPYTQCSPLHLITAGQEETWNMLRLSLINVAVKSGPPSPCPFCCSVLVPLRCPQSQEQIVTLMMDIYTTPPSSSSYSPSAGLGSLASLSSFSSLSSPGTAERGSQPVRQADMFTPSVQTEQKTTLHTDFISTDKFEGGMGVDLFRRL